MLKDSFKGRLTHPGQGSKVFGDVKWTWVEAISVGLLAVIGVDVVLSLVVGLGLGVYSGMAGVDEARLEGITSSIVFNFAFYGTARLLGLVLILRFLKRKGIRWEQLGIRSFKFLKSLGLIITASLALLVTSTYIFYLLGRTVPSLDLEKEQEVIFSAASNTPELVMAFFALVILAPFVEEIIFRGFMLPAFAKRFGVIWGVLISSLLFGLVHWQLNVGIITFIMGLLLAWIYIKSSSLVPAIIFHSLKNLVAFLLIF